MRTTSLPATSLTVLSAVLSAVTAGTVAGCGTAETEPGPGTMTSASSSPTPTFSPHPSRDEENDMNLELTIGDQRFRATLSESAAARDLIAQLPVTIEMTDHGGVEETGHLPSPLSLEGQPEGADPAVGDLGYYAPGNDLVLSYGDQSLFPGIVVLGRLDGDAAERIAELDGSVRATVAAAAAA